jgi:3-hydroxybutyryl-CoA dehydrogenase
MQTGIIGSGAMGSGIAQVAATAGHEVVLFDSRPEALTRSRDQMEATLNRLAAKGRITNSEAVAIFGRCHFATSLSAMRDCRLVIEAIVEDEAVKKGVFAELETHLAPDAVIASNTSSLSIAGLAAGCRHPERFLGLHFFNPAPLMPLVEIIPALQTEPDLPQRMYRLMLDWGKTPVYARDTPGFIVNRIARPYYSESIRIVEEGLATPAQMDQLMKERGGFRMGPFELMDFIGHDVNYAVTESVWKACFHEPRYQPSFTQRRLVEAGWLGRKSGRGFFDYREGAPAVSAEPLGSDGIQDLFDRVLAMLINEAADALYYGVAGREDIDTAMTRGVNYPKGLLRWADEWGPEEVEAALDRLFDHYHDPRYRCSPALRTLARRGERFYPETPISP